MRRTVLQVINETMHGAPTDQLADLEARIGAERTNAAGAIGDLEELAQARRVAEDFEAARALDEKIARAQWAIERAEALLPQLEAERDVLMAARRRESLARHKAAIGKLYPKLRRAIDAAVIVQSEAIAARQSAVAEIGEGLVQANIPVVAFMGLLLPDLVEIWSAEMDRAFAAPQLMPATAPPAARPKAVDLGNAMTPRGVRLDQPPATARVRRPLRRDTEAGEGERLVTILRSGVDIDGFQTINGDVLAMPLQTADRLVASGAADFAN